MWRAIYINYNDVVIFLSPKVVDTLPLYKLETKVSFDWMGQFMLTTGLATYQALQEENFTTQEVVKIPKMVISGIILGILANNPEEFIFWVTCQDDSEEHWEPASPMYLKNAGVLGFSLPWCREYL